jgi:hypothetical protein
MHETTHRVSARLDPTAAWSIATDGPLRGLALAREAGMVLAWDEGDHLYWIDSLGERRSVSRAPAKILAAAVSDDGSILAVLVEGPRLWLLGPDLEPLSDRTTIAEASALAVDPHGRYVAIASRLNQTQFYSRHGRLSGKLETLRPLSHICFVPTQPLLFAASANGWMAGISLEPTGSLGTLRSEVLWQNQRSNLGRLAITGDGGIILASCYNLGVQRYDSRGENEGSYHLGGTAIHAVPDFAGRTIVVATQEGELAVLNQGGNVRWKTGLPRPVLALETDALGRYLIYGLPTGEICRLDLDGTGKAPPARTTTVRPASPMRSGSIREPDWVVPAASSLDQAAITVLTVLDDPPRIGLMNNLNTLQIFNQQGESLGKAPQILGGGRSLVTDPGWIGVTTDKMALLYDARRDGARRLDLHLVAVTHFAIRPDTYGMAIVQEGDRVARATQAGRWVWKRELKSLVEGLAIGPQGFTGFTTQDGQFQVLDPAGEPAGSFSAEPVEPLCLVDAPAGAPEEVAWITLARRLQILRGHRTNGRVIWEAPVPWEAWQLHRVGPLVVVSAPDGRALSFDVRGNPQAQSRAEAARGIFFPSPSGEAWRAVAQGEHLICTDLEGKVQWRAVAEVPVGPLAAGRNGVAAMVGRSLAWFSAPRGAHDCTSPSP